MHVLQTRTQQWSHYSRYIIFGHILKLPTSSYIMTVLPTTGLHSPLLDLPRYVLLYWVAHIAHEVLPHQACLQQDFHLIEAFMRLNRLHFESERPYAWTKCLWSHFRGRFALVAAISTQWKDVLNRSERTNSPSLLCRVDLYTAQISLMDQNNLIKSQSHPISRDKFRQSQIGAAFHPPSASHCLNNSALYGGLVGLSNKQKSTVYRRLQKIGIKRRQRSPSVCCLCCVQ